MIAPAAAAGRTLWLLFLVGLLLALEAKEAQEKCSFSTDDYSVRWRYEKSTNNVIFFLKTAGQGDNFWSGIGFGRENKNVSTDFISVFVKKGQFGLADMHAGRIGQLFADTFTNVQVISFDVDKGKLMAQFSRSLAASDEDDVDLKGCTRFFFPVKSISTENSDKKVLKESDLVSKIICDIPESCELDDAGLVSGNSGSKKVEFAMSVDTSGTGDPCSFKGEEYDVSWKYDKKNDTVKFDMQFPMKGGKWWSAVGIGDTMQDMDMVVLFLDNGILKSSGDYFSSGYTVPSKDDSQDWHVDKKEAKVVDGKVHLKFSRSLETDDKSNDRSLDGCVLFQFAANLGKYGSRFGIRKHEDWPDLYKACGIKEHCSSTKKPRFAQAKDEAVENVQSVENSGEEPEEKFTTTEVSPVEMVDASVTAQNGTAAPVRSALEEDSLLTSAETPAVPSSEAPSTEASSAPTEASTTSEIPATSEITTVTIQAQDLITAVTEASTEPSTEASTVGNVVEEAATEPTASETQPEASTTAETTETEATAPSTTAVKKECEEGHEDLTVCQSYIDDYFGEVKEWAQKHNETLDAQRWKACSLLQKVPHVPNLCCTSYLDVCRNHLPQTQLQTGTI